MPPDDPTDKYAGFDKQLSEQIKHLVSPPAFEEMRRTLAASQNIARQLQSITQGPSEISKLLEASRTAFGQFEAARATLAANQENLRKAFDLTPTLKAIQQTAALYKEQFRVIQQS